jgi:hypothetical protein
MSTSPIEIAHAPSCNARQAWRNGSQQTWWAQHREASLNWLALGLLLAAWNASDNDASGKQMSASNARGRPEALRGYSHISVRAVNRAAAEAGG